MRSSTIHRTALAAAALGLTLGLTAPTATAAGPALAANEPVTVTLTITGPDSTLYNDEISTTGHTVSPVTGGDQICDGTNNGANPTAGATPTAALDDAASQEGFTWDGVWYASFDDYLVTDIDGDIQTADAFWEISVNGTVTPVGGCQFLLAEGDEIAFTWTEMD